jgi:hypothetical protein
MRDKPWLLAIVGVLGAVAMVYNVRAYSALWTGPKGDPGAADTGFEPEEETDEQAVKAVLGAIPHSQITAMLAGLTPSRRDPFFFATGVQAVVQTAQSGLVLHGTLVGPRRVAWINQRARSVGEEIDGHVLERIEVDHVTLRRGDEEIELWPEAQ